MIDLSSNQPLHLMVFERVVGRHLGIVALILALISITAMAILH